METRPGWFFNVKTTTTTTTRTHTFVQGPSGVENRAPVTGICVSKVQKYNGCNGEEVVHPLLSSFVHAGRTLGIKWIPVVLALWVRRSSALNRAYFMFPETHSRQVLERSEVWPRDGPKSRGIQVRFAP